MRLGAVDLQHPERGGIVAHQQGAAFVRPPPHALFADRKIQAAISCHGIGVQQPKLVGGESASRGCRGFRSTFAITCRTDSGYPGMRGRVLVLAIDVERKPAVVGAGAESGDVVHALPVRPAVIVDQRLAEVIAVVHRRSRNVHHARVDRIQLDRFHRPPIPGRQFIGEFRIESLLELQDFAVAGRCGIRRCSCISISM